MVFLSYTISIALVDINIKTIIMKKRNFTTFHLKKEYIAHLKHTSTIVGGKSTKCNFSQSPLCLSKFCDSKAFQDCTVTYEACVTQPRFCSLV